MKQRIISGSILLIALLSVLFWAPPAIFYLVALLIAGISVWEYTRLLYRCPEYQGDKVDKLYAFRYLFHAMLLVVTAVPFIYWGQKIFGSGEPVYVDTVIYQATEKFIRYGAWVWFLSAFIYFKTEELFTKVSTFVVIIFSMMINVSFFFAIFTIRFYHIVIAGSPELSKVSFDLGNSPLLFLYIILLVAASDSGAYFIGRKFGKRKLNPTISPNKTIEGLIGGILSSVVVATLFVLCSDVVGTTKTSYQIFFVVISAATVLFSVNGDLFESFLKRRSGVKDSSNLIPGHGGILDRLDSLQPAFVIFSYFWIFNVLEGVFKL